MINFELTLEEAKKVRDALCLKIQVEENITSFTPQDLTNLVERLDDLLVLLPKRCAECGGETYIMGELTASVAFYYDEEKKEWVHNENKIEAGVCVVSLPEVPHYICVECEDLTTR